MAVASPMLRDSCLYNITAVVLQPFTEVFPAGIARAAGVLLAQGWLLTGNGTYAPSFADAKLQELCLNLLFMNDGFDQNQAASQAEAAAQDYPHFVGFIGPSGSSLCRSVSEVADRMNPIRPVLGISCTATSLSNKENYPNFYRTALPDDVVSEAILGFAVYLGSSSIGCIFADAEYPRSIAAAIDQKALERNLVPFRYVYEVGDTTFETVIDLTTREGAPRFLAAVGEGAEDSFLLLKRLWTENMHQTRVFVSADIMASGQPAMTDLAMASSPTGAAIFQQMRVVAFKAEGSHPRLESFTRDWPSLVSEVDLALLESVSGYALPLSERASLPSFVVESIHAVLYMAHAAHKWLSGDDANNLGSAMKLLTGTELDSIYGTLELDQNHDPVPHGYVVPMYRYKGESEPAQIGTYLFDATEFELDVSEIEDLPSVADESSPGGSSDDDSSMVVIIGAIGGGALLLCCCCAAVLLWRIFAGGSGYKGSKAKKSPEVPLPAPVGVTQAKKSPEVPLPAPVGVTQEEQHPKDTMSVEILIAQVRMSEKPFAYKLEATGMLFDKKLRAVVQSRQRALDVQKLLHGKDNPYGSNQLPKESLDEWHIKLQTAIVAAAKDRTFSDIEKENLLMLDCALLSLESMSLRVQDFWNVLLDDRPFGSDRPPVTRDAVDFISRHWEKLHEADTRLQGGASASSKRSLFAYLMMQPHDVVMTTFASTCGTPASAELERDYPFLGLARLLCRRDPKEVLDKVSAELNARPSRSSPSTEAAVRAVLPREFAAATGGRVPESRATLLSAAIFLVLHFGCGPDPEREQPLSEVDAIGCLIAWGVRGSVSQDGAGADANRRMLAEDAPKLVLERVRSCTDEKLRTKTLVALQHLFDVREPIPVNDFVVGLLRLVIDQDWLSVTPPIDRKIVVGFIHSLPLAFRSPHLPESLLGMLKDVLVRFVEETPGLQSRDQRYKLVQNLCYDDGIVSVPTLLGWYTENFLCGRLLSQQTNDPWGSGGLEDYIFPAILGNPTTKPPREGALSAKCKGAPRMTDRQRTAMVEALGAVTLEPKWHALFALRLSQLIPVQNATQTGAKPPLTWDDNGTREFIARVFGQAIVTRYSNLPSAMWGNNYSWKEIKEQLFNVSRVPADVFGRPTGEPTGRGDDQSE